MMTKPMFLEPTVWGCHFWFVLHTIAYTYPLSVTSITKKKYYDFIQNIPLFLPNEDIGDKFSELLNTYPVTPYLDCRESFMRWMNFIHNKINISLGKPKVPFQDSIEEYRNIYHHHKWNRIQPNWKNEIHTQLTTKTIVYCTIVGLFMMVIGQKIVSIRTPILR